MQSSCPMWLRIVVWMLRILIGGVFVFSGLVKAIDLWGFIFKIEEYLAVWHLAQPRSVVLVVALLIVGYEFVLGALLMIGCYKRTAPSALLLMMAVMLPLTLYLWISDPVSDCGCFGEFVKISNAATFWKNVIIVAGLVMLLRWSPKVHEALFNPAIQWMVAALFGFYIMWVGLYGYFVQPVADFRSYPIGTALAPDVDSSADDVPDYVFVYEKDGETRNFDINNLPDSTWNFVDRLEVGGDKASTGPENPLTVFDSEGNDVTDYVFEPEGLEYVVVIPELRRADVAYSFTLNEMYEQAEALGTPMIALIGADARGIARWEDLSMAEYPCYSADETQLKELARGVISIVVLSDGRVVSKSSLSSMSPSAIENPRSPEQFRAALLGYGNRWFRLVSGVFGAVFLLIYLFQGLIITIRNKIRRAYRRKNAKKS